MNPFIIRKVTKIVANMLLEHKDLFIQVGQSTLNWWRGKKIAVIGPEETGKDALWNRLQGLDPQAPLSLDKTKIPHFKIDFRLSNGKKINLTCKRSLNIGGEENHRDQSRGWKAVCNDANIIFYLITIDDLQEKSYLKGRIKSDLQWLYKTTPYLKNDPHLHILINKIDTKISSHTDYADFENKLRSELNAFDAFVKGQLEPWDKIYTGSTLISIYNENLYLRGIENVFNEVYEHISNQK